MACICFWPVESVDKRGLLTCLVILLMADGCTMIMAGVSMSLLQAADLMLPGEKLLGWESSHIPGAERQPSYRSP